MKLYYAQEGDKTFGLSLTYGLTVKVSFMSEDFSFEPNFDASTFGASSQLKARSFSQGQPLALDPEISEVHDQIDEVEANIAKLKSDIKTKTALYESEIERINSEIEKKKIDVETQLSLLREQNTQELNALQELQEQELEELRQRLEDTRKQKDNFAEKHSEAIRVNKEAEIAALKNQLERRRIKSRDQGFAQTTLSQQDKMEQQQREAELQAQIEIIDAEINEVAASRNEELQRARVKMDETSAAFEARQREQQAKLERYKDEISKRQLQYEEQIRALESQKDMEKEALETELKETNERLQGLQQLYSKMEKGNSREIQLTQQDIDRLNVAVQEAKKREEEQLEEAKQQIARLQDAQSDNVAIEQELEAVRQRIAQIKSDNTEMRKERQRLDTTIYSTRITRHRSTLK